MPFLAVTRGGVADVVRARTPRSGLWVGADVLSAIEVQRLRADGIEITVFDRPVRTVGEIEDAIPTLSEHHPGEPVWVESLPETYNPTSSDYGSAFLRQEFIVGVRLQRNESVVVVSGPHSGERGILIGLLGLEPEPEFVVRTESGHDIHVLQPVLDRVRRLPSSE